MTQGGVDRLRSTSVGSVGDSTIGVQPSLSWPSLTLSPSGQLTPGDLGEGAAFEDCVSKSRTEVRAHSDGQT